MIGIARNGDQTVDGQLGVVAQSFVDEFPSSVAESAPLAQGD
jgi:hypothetical protein